jgi:hypothetical protein
VWRMNVMQQEVKQSPLFVPCWSATNTRKKEQTPKT